MADPAQAGAAGVELFRAIPAVAETIDDLEMQTRGLIENDDPDNLALFRATEGLERARYELNNAAAAVAMFIGYKTERAMPGHRIEGGPDA